MSLQTPTKSFLKYLKNNPSVRLQIRARPDKTLLYCGSSFGPMWQVIAREKRIDPQLADKQTLPEVVAMIATPGTGHMNLQAYAQAVEGVVPWKPDGFIVWRALSGIFASNAAGKVSFMIGSGATTDKVFVATEVSVLLRNPNISGLTRDILEYYQRCINNKQWDMNFGFISA